MVAPRELLRLQHEAHTKYDDGKYADALCIAEDLYMTDTARTENLLLLGAINFQLRNFSEAIFFNQQALRLEPQMSEAYSNLANALKELGDVRGAMQFYLKAIKYKPRFGDAYNNLASAHMQLGHIFDAMETYQMSIVVDPKLVDAHNNLGNLFKAQGKLEAARKCFLEAIRLNPEFSIAWSNLASIFKGEGQNPTAVAYYREAIRLCPQFADVYSNLGSSMQDQGNLLEAKQCYQIAIRLRPDLAIAHGNLGSCLLAAGNPEGAVCALRHAIQLEPSFPDAYNNLGNALRILAKPRVALRTERSKHGTNLLISEARREAYAREAIACYRRALRLKPNHPHAYSNLGNAMRDRGLVREAIHCNVTAARLMPCFAPAHANLGSLLREQGLLDQAIAHYHQAIALDSDFVEAYTNLGHTYRELGQRNDAVKCYTTALKIAPHIAEVHVALAAVHVDGGNPEDAIVCYERALRLEPFFPDAVSGLLRAKDSVCDWNMRDINLDKLVAVLETQLQVDDYDDVIIDSACRDRANRDLDIQGIRDQAFHGTLPCIQPLDALALTNAIAPRDVQRLTRRFAARARANLMLSPILPFQHHQQHASRLNGNRDETRINVAYLSGNFGDHPTGHLLAPLLKYHNRSRFFVACYSLTPSDGSSWYMQINRGVEGSVKDLSFLSAVDAAGAIHDDGVNLLVHLDGHSANVRNEILALRPAPIQIAFVLGFCGTSGADYVDYLVADHIVVGPPKQCGTLGTQYSVDERVLLLPDSCILNGHAVEYHVLLQNLQNQNALPTRASYSVPEDAFVFAYFGHISKLEPIAFAAWMEILIRVPNSLLWLQTSTKSVISRLRNEASRLRVHAERLFFTDIAPKHERIYCSILADLVLDTPSCNALDASLDALWAGTPVVSLLGSTIATRLSASLCTAALCPELVTATLADYKDLAVLLALDADKYWPLRKKLEDSRVGLRAPLFDYKMTLRHLELGYEAIWAKVLAQSPPADIIIST